MTENEIKGAPIIYLDMDGVLADFDEAYHRKFGQAPAPTAKEDPYIQQLRGSDFFATLNKLPDADKVVSLAKKFGNGKYSICSSPLRDDIKNTSHWKAVWLKKHYGSSPPEHMVFTGKKDSYAVRGDQWNVLIDDKPRNIDAWNTRGGKGILYNGYTDSIEYLESELKKIFTNDKAEVNEDSDDSKKNEFKEMFGNFLPIAIEVLHLKSLPEFHFEAFLDHPHQPTFGMYVNGENKLYVGLSGRHPNDILRTIAHELTHYKQDTEHKLDDNSGRTGSPEENEANSVAGVIMRIFNKKYPHYLKSKPVMESETDESLKGIAAAGLLGLGMLGGPKDVASGNLPQDLQKAQQQHRVQMAKKPMAKTAVAKPAAAKPLPAKATPLLKVAKANGITGVELAQFLAQMEHESLDFKKMKEIGKSTYFNKYDNKLGNKFKGDGAQFRGRGFIQLTGRGNYTQASRDIFGDDRLVKKPDLAAQPDIAARIAVWYWTDRVKPLVKDFSDTTRVTKIINGGLNGLQDRENNFRDYMASLGLMEKWSMKYKKSINCANPKGFSQRAHCQGRKKTEDVEQDPGQPIPFPAGTTSIDVSDPYDWYKLGMVISDLDDANPKAFGKGGPSTVIAFGSEDEEHRLLPHLKRLGLKLQDIDKPSDTEKIVPAKAVLDKFEENFADGRNPQDKGDSGRHGIKKGISIAQLKKIRSSDSASPRKKQLAHWQINMRQGRSKKG